MNNMDKKLLVSRIKTPDGTILHSKHRHDYVTHIDANGEEYMLDGGNDYQRVSVNIEPFKDISLYDDSPFEEIRKAYCRGGRGKNGDQHLKWVPLCEMSDEWLKNCITYNDEFGLSKSISTYLYCKELKYRQRMEITIEDYDTE
jgi:hypothetical protein